MIDLIHVSKIRDWVVSYQLKPFLEGNTWVFSVALVTVLTITPFHFKQNTILTKIVGKVAEGEMPKPKSPLSYGLIWHAADTIDVSLSHQHLDHIGVGIQVSLDTQQTPTQYKPVPFISSLDKVNSVIPDGLNPDFWYDNLLLDVERSDLFILGVKLFPTQGRAEIEINNDDYVYWPDALAQAHRLASLHLPNNINRVDYVINEQGACFTYRQFGTS